MGGNAAVVQALLEIDTLDLDGVCNLGRTPLWYSVDAWDTTTTTILLGRGANPNRSDLAGSSPLHRASIGRNGENFKSVDMLLADGHVDVNARDKLGKTPLHWAVKNENNTLVRALLGREDIDLNVADGEGDTPLLLCARLLSERFDARDMGDIAEFLAASEKVNLNRRDSYGRTALAFAARAGSDSLVSLLLSRGADPKVTDDCGMTPLELAVRKEHREVVRLLLSHGGEDPGRFDWLWDRDSGASWAEHVLSFVGPGALASRPLRRSRSMEAVVRFSRKDLSRKQVRF